MAENPLLGNLSKGALAALPYITGLVNQGAASATQILTAVRAAGYSIRTQTLYDVVNVLQGNISTARAIRLTPSNVPLDPANYGTSVNPTLRNYSYKVLLRTTDVDTGEILNRHVTVSSNEAMTPDNIMAKGQSYGVSGKYGDNISVDSVQIVDALKSPDLEG